MTAYLSRHLTTRRRFCEAGRAAARAGRSQFDRPFAGDSRAWAVNYRGCWYVGFFTELERMTMEQPETKRAAPRDPCEGAVDAPQKGKP